MVETKTIILETQRTMSVGIKLYGISERHASVGLRNVRTTSGRHAIVINTFQQPWRRNQRPFYVKKRKKKFVFWERDEKRWKKECSQWTSLIYICKIDWTV